MLPAPFRRSESTHRARVQALAALAPPRVTANPNPESRDRMTRESTAATDHAESE
jgi:hypothetical protein